MSTRSETASETPIDEVRMHFGVVLEALLEEKAKNCSSMYGGITHLRGTNVSEVTTPPASDIVQQAHNLSTTSSGDTLGSIRRALDRKDDSVMDSRDDDSTSSLRYCTHAPRGLLSTRNSTVSQTRRVQSETNEELPFPAPQRLLELELPSMSLITSMMGSTLLPFGSSRNSDPCDSTSFMPAIEYEHLDFTEELGRGHFASVKLASWNGVKVAVKEWHSTTDADSRDMAMCESATLAFLRHPCVVAFYGRLCSGPSPGLVVEYLQHSSLKYKLQELKGKALETRKLKYGVALRAARGMEFLHSRKVIHFDLKCDNLLCDLRDPDHPVVKIGDMGLSKEKIQTFISGNMRGTLPWMAPELFPKAESIGSQGNVTDRVNEKVDIYSFGVVLWEIWEMGEMPYPTLGPSELLEGILNSSLELPCPDGCDPQWETVMYQCLETEPSNRPDFSTIINKLEQASRAVDES